MQCCSNALRLGQEGEADQIDSDATVQVGGVWTLLDVQCLQYSPLCEFGLDLLHCGFFPAHGKGVPGVPGMHCNTIFSVILHHRNPVFIEMFLQCPSGFTHTYMYIGHPVDGEETMVKEVEPNLTNRPMLEALYIYTHPTTSTHH